MPQFDVICVGLSEAGKTTLLSLLSKQDMTDISPTTGFEIRACVLENCVLNVKEVGGGKNMRQYWKHYYKGMQGLVFVVDSASSNEDMDVAVTGLRDAIFNRDLVCVPCLILANCQDKPDARSYDEIKDYLNLDNLCQGHPWRLQTCSMFDIHTVEEGFNWMASQLLSPHSKKTED